MLRYTHHVQKMKNPIILVDVNEYGEVDVHWHDPEMSGRIPPQIYYRDTKDGVCVPNGIKSKDVRGFEELCKDQWTQQIF